ncbi:hypothetical protein BpHYR1_031699 [Brachionus plicatilis]|uniref:Uncharacterized protein n=1 Tax=Brachionus plicatilis TaxID=10195 RepID=A0A3M7QPM4_BRAPC|nr:hypothetical protein BpHYR1_031699 [Brachionus plicatilis]
MSRLKSSFSWNNLRQTEEDKKELGELNSRFVNFISLVKSEQKKCDTLTQSVNELKRKIFGDRADSRQKYDNQLNTTRRELNDLCLQLNACMIKERNSRYLIRFYSNVDVLPMSSAHENWPNLAAVDNWSDKLSCQLSASQSSLLSSCSSQSIAVSSSSSSSSSCSSPASSYSTELPSLSSYLHSPVQSPVQSPVHSSSVDSSSVDTSSVDYSSSPSLFSLQTYLNTLNQSRSHLSEQYEFKLAECEKLKKQCSHLNQQLFDLNNNLDTVRLDNTTLHANIQRLSKQINFYTNHGICTKSIDQSVQSGQSVQSVQSGQSGQTWYANELDLLKREIRQEFENGLKQELDQFEQCLQHKALTQIDNIQQDYDKEYERVEAESTALLNELCQLNEQLCHDFDQYQQLRAENSQLNNRMIELSTKLIDFNQMDQSLQDKMILNYSVKCLAKDVQCTRQQVNTLRKQLNQIKADLNQKNMFSFSQSKFNLKPYTVQIVQSPNASLDTNPTTATNTSTPINATTFDTTTFDTNAIKSNPSIDLYSYLIVKFDFIHNSVSGKNRSILNSLKLNDDSIDGHWLSMHNEHKILDIDLSEWQIRREIYSTIEQVQPHQTIEYRLPKFFKLKRRKKVNFVCSANNLDLDTCSSLSFNSLPKLTQLKCACCACKLMVKQNGDTDILQVKDVHNWGTGSLTVTKLIDKKNTIKMANFTFSKQLWLNEKNRAKIHHHSSVTTSVELTTPID